MTLYASNTYSVDVHILSRVDYSFARPGEQFPPITVTNAVPTLPRRNVSNYSAWYVQCSHVVQSCSAVCEVQYV